MADVKISALTALGAAPAAADQLPIVDSSAGATKKVTIAELFTNPNVTGTVTADGLTVDGDGSLKTSDGAILTVGTTNISASAGQVVGQITFDNADISPNKTNAEIRGMAFDAFGRTNIDFRTGNSGVLATRALINWNGDISFYEDTGTTAKFFWDASAESLDVSNAVYSNYFAGVADRNTWMGIDGTDVIRFTTNSSEAMRIDSSGNVGIGTTSPTHSVTVLSSDGNVASFGRDLTTDVYFNISADNDGTICSTTGVHNMRFFTSATERMRIDSSGNVGIGTTSPASYGANYTTLALNGSVGGVLDFEDDGVRIGSIYNGSNSLQIGTIANGPLIFSANNTEAARIDSSGNLLVGTTSATNTTAGIRLYAGGNIGASINGTPLEVNRLSTDGNVLVLKKDGATVGNLGSILGQYLSIGTGDVGFAFDDDLDKIVPWNTSTNVARDSAVDLGGSSQRFKDLYLSGGVYLGGTGAANLLDDYEEGTFTPAFSGNAGVSGMAYSTQTGSYTKIGDTVTVHINLSVSTLGTLSGTFVTITGLPFVASSTAQGCISYFANVNGHKPCVSGYIVASSSAILISATNSTNDDMTVGNFPISSITATTQINLSLTYKTSA